MFRRRVKPHAAVRLFARYAAACLVPVLVLGFVLAARYRGDADARGLAEARAQAGLLARTAITPALGGRPVTAALPDSARASLRQTGANAVAAGQIVRFRLRTTAGDVAFSSDGVGRGQAADDEALDAARGEVVARVTRLDADERGTTNPGERVAEVYFPLTAAADGTGARLGVLEIYLPYAPIAHDVEAGLTTLYVSLGTGLGALYVLLAAISWSATRRLRGQIARTTHLAEHDALTGLPNRMLFQRRLQEAMSAARAGGPPVSVALIDLDRFKDVNDTLGHSNGDELLRALGERIAYGTRAADTIARLGGDEFGVVLLGDQSAEDVTGVLARLQATLEEEIEVGGLPLTAEASIGFAMYPTDGEDPDTLLQHADVAMYVAKGGNPSIVRYRSDQDHYDSGRLALVAELKRAIANDELVLHYQPQIGLRAGEPVAVEALVRWRHPERGLLYPDVFVPVAEQTGLVEALTRWVLDSALHQLAGWGRVADDLALAVNVSARNLAHVGFAQVVEDSLARAGVAADRLILEMTETAFVADPERAAATLRALDATGVRVSLDDFGRGQTSLGYLSTLPLHEVKIDKGFVSDMLTDPTHAAIVRSVIELAHNLGFVVVAEGVEDEPTRRTLADLRCDIAQGYLVARPMAASALPGWLDHHEAARQGALLGNA